MPTRMYYGKIFLKSSGHPIQVRIETTSSYAATKAIEGEYGNNFKQWTKHMSVTP